MKIQFESRAEKITAVLLGVSVAVIVIGVGLQHYRTRTFQEQRIMTAHDRVLNVLKNWAHRSSVPDDGDQIQVIWATSHSALPFYPDSVQLLTAQMQKEFRDSSTVVLEYTDIYDAAQNPGGTVKTVSELARLVRSNYHPG